MAPEYFLGEPLGPWTDVYALGVTLYRKLTGGDYPRPEPDVSNFRRDDQRSDCALDALGWNPSPLAPSAHRSDVPRGLDYVLLQSLATDPALRFPSAGAFCDALRSVRGGGQSRAPRHQASTDLADDRKGAGSRTRRALSRRGGAADPCRDRRVRLRPEPLPA